MHIGLLRRSALGDVILWSALVEQCLRRYPDVSITWMIDPAFITLFETLPRLQWCSLPKPNSWRSYRTCIKTLRKHHFDTLLCAQASLRSNLLYPFCSATRKIGFDPMRGRDGHGLTVNERIPYRDNHLIEGFAQFFEQAGYPLDLNDLHWPIASDARALPKENVPSKQSVGLVVSASKIERTWPLSHQTEFVIQLLQAPSFSGCITLLGGNTTLEKAIAQSIVADCSQQLPAATLERLHNRVGKTSLQTLPAELERLDCVVAPDTGPAHLAHALNIPVIGLYAVARSALSGPYTSRLTIDVYAQAAQQLLGRSISQLGWHERIHHAKAMGLITPDQVLTQTLHILQNRHSNPALSDHSD